MPAEAPETGKPACSFVSGIIDRKEPAGDDYYQARYRYRNMSAKEKDHLIANFTEALSQVYEPIKRRMLEHFMRTDKELGSRIAQSLNMTM